MIERIVESKDRQAVIQRISCEVQSRIILSIVPNMQATRMAKIWVAVFPTGVLPNPSCGAV